MRKYLIVHAGHEHINQLRPALLRGHMHGHSPLLALYRAGAPQGGQLLHSCQAIPGGCAVQRCAAIAILHAHAAALRATGDSHFHVCPHPSLFNKLVRSMRTDSTPGRITRGCGPFQALSRFHLTVRLKFGK